VLVLKGKPWTVEEEKQLRQMLQEHKSVRSIAKILGKTRDCIRMKIVRLGLEVVVQPEKNQRTTTTAKLVVPGELFSVEEVMKELHSAVAGLKTPGLDKTEVIRLRGIIAGCKVYKEMLADYLDYCGLEAELLELREKYAELAKKSHDAVSK
jgi:hypothetical protein